MRIEFDIGGVLSKYPLEFRTLINTLGIDCDIFIITDQHPKEEVMKVLKNNHFLDYVENNHFLDYVEPWNIYCADYEKYGNMAKAVLIKELEIEIFFDDFDGYLQWDSSLGPQPILLKVMPDAFKPYWSDDWKLDENQNFGRRKYSIVKRS